MDPTPDSPAGCGNQGEDRNGSHVHCCALDEGGALLLSLRHRHGQPQHFTVASWQSWIKPPGSSPGTGNLTNAGCAPHPAHIHQIPGRSKLKGRNHRFLSYSFPSRSPDPHHLAVLARPGFVRAAPIRPGTSRDRLPSAPPPCCDKVSGEGLSPPLATTAPHGADPQVSSIPHVRFVATITRTYQVDDLDGSEDDVSTVQLALDERAMRSTAVVLAAMVVLGIVNKIVA